MFFGKAQIIPMYMYSTKKGDILEVNICVVQDSKKSISALSRTVRSQSLHCPMSRTVPLNLSFDHYSLQSISVLFRTARRNMISAKGEHCTLCTVSCMVLFVKWIQLSNYSENIYGHSLRTVLV